ncbi:hypothetical protein BH24DEI2_BH24DEI2_03570 [soil metagenome]
MPNLPRSTPEAQGIASSAISSFVEAVGRKKLELHSLMLVRHGQVIAEGWWRPYRATDIHLLYSMSKSFTATAVGIAVAESLLEVNDRVVSFFPDETPDSLDEHLAHMTVEHLLTMTTGHLKDTIGQVAKHPNSWVNSFLSLPPDVPPGTVFTYNNGATFMLSAILHKLTGTPLLEYLRPRLLEPLGIEDAYWQQNPQGIQLGFSGLHVTTESVARFGQLYLDEGHWENKQLIPQAWVHAAKTKHIQTNPPPEDEVTDWAQGYGYQFWLCRHDAYRGDGAFSQFCVIMPEQDAVLAITSGENDMQAVLDLVWQHLLPAFESTAEPTALPESQTSFDELQETLARLEYPPLKGSSDSSIGSRVLGQTFHFDSVAVQDPAHTSFDTLQLKRSADTWSLLLEGEKTHEIVFGHEEWRAGTTTFFTLEQARTATCGAWLDAHTLEVQVRYIETPHCLNLTLHFTEDALQLDMRWNVRFSDLDLPPMNGHRLG